MSDAADSPVWSRSSDVLCSYSSRANDSHCLQVPYPTEPGSTTVLPAVCLQISTKTEARDFLLIKLSSPTSRSHKTVCCVYMHVHVFALVQPQISRGECILESNKYKGKLDVIHVIISPAAFLFLGISPRKVGLHYISPCLWNSFGNKKRKCPSIFSQSKWLL